MTGEEATADRRDGNDSIVSVVVPVHNEVEAIEPVVNEVLECQPRLPPKKLEILVVDDGSTDGTWERIQRCCRMDTAILGIRLRKNFGKGVALKVGFAKASGSCVVTMDGDLQDDAASLPDFVRMVDQGCEVVSGWKRNRRDPWHKVLPSRMLNWLVRKLFKVPVHDLNCGLKAFSREVTRHVPLYGELYRYMVVFAHEKGFRVAEKEVGHRSRKYGCSKYGWRRLIRGFLDLLTVRFLTTFEARPLHLLGAIGLGLIGIGGLGLGWLAFLWVIGLGPIGDRPLLPYSGFTIVFGGQIMTLGILAELIVSKTRVGETEVDGVVAEVEMSQEGGSEDGK